MVTGHRIIWSCLFVTASVGFLIAAGGNGVGGRTAWAARRPPRNWPRLADERPAQSVTLKTADGWNLAGLLFLPGAPARSRSAVILLHQRGGSGSDWVRLCRALQGANITALAIDQRGAAHSTQGPGPVGEDAPWLTSRDVAAAVAFLKGKGTLGLAGASYGANNALIYAAAHPGQIKAVALYSPGANYHGLDAVKPAHAYKGAVVIYHDLNDSVAGDGPKRINAALPAGDHVLRVSLGGEHGTALLTPANVRDATAFFLRTLK
jgi:pimeloyl-ACP methyl ester carboxylesterase